MLKYIYPVALKLYELVIIIAAYFNPKAKNWVDGRISVFNILQKQCFHQPIWFHCASLGEYLQAKPIMQALKKKHPQSTLIVSFFSPSGYNYINESLIDFKFYLPLDSKTHAQKLVSIIKPKQVFFVKYEFWMYLLRVLKQQHIPTHLICCAIHPKHKLISPWAKTFFNYLLSHYTSIHCQDKTTFSLLYSVNKHLPLHLSGDTRVDQVQENKKNMTKLPFIERFKDGFPLLITGSSWPKEEKLIIDYMHQTQHANLKYIIAPHDVSKRHIDKIETALSLPYIRYSNITNLSSLKEYKVLIIDGIGLLAQSYQYSQIAFVGGGFSGRLHNVLEPAVFGNAIIFGNYYQKFHEANQLVNQGGAIAIENHYELKKLIDTCLQNKSYLHHIQNQAQQYILEHTDATQRILNQLHHE